jgi:hypothetical protein
MRTTRVVAALCLLAMALGCQEKNHEWQGEPPDRCWYGEDCGPWIADGAGPMGDGAVVGDDGGTPVADAGVAPGGEGGEPIPTADGGPVGSCSAVLQGDELCLACVDAAGKEVYRECKPASQACKTVTTPTEICIECKGATGTVLLKHCAPISQTCKAEQIGAKLCLVCRDATGQKVSESCPP